MKQNLTTTQIKDIIDSYIAGRSTRALSEQYGFKCQKSITKILRKNNIIVRSKKEAAQSRKIIFSQEDIDNLLLMNSSPQTSLTEMAQYFDVDPKIIKKQIAKHSVFNANKYDEFLINKFDNIDAEEKAYWLGFLAADGWASEKQLSLQLAEKDLSHLLKFKNFIGVDYKISKYETNLDGKIFIGYRYVVSSTNFVKSLEKHGIVPNKSLILSFANTINDNLIKHYIRGLIDGDGSFYIHNDRLNFSLISSLEVCKKVQQYLMSNCDVSKTKLEEKETENGDKYYYLKYCGSPQVCRIAEYLYDGANVFLERKKELVYNFKLNHKFRQKTGVNNYVQ